MSSLTIHELDSVISGRRRKVRVWLPPEYHAEPSRRFPVLVMHDGQNVFTDRDAELPYGSWGVDWWMLKLAAEGRIAPAIVVGVDNSPARQREYFPVTEEYTRYKRILLEEVLPYVRGNWRTDDSAAGTMLMGSSMGGLVSFALASDLPEVFGACACLSPWFEWEHFRYIHDVLRPRTEKPPIRVFFDSGIFDWRGLDDGHRGMLMARVELLRLGFAEGPEFRWLVDTHFCTEEELKQSHVNPDKYAIAAWNQHNEFQWRRRLDAPLQFLLGES